jgi:uncharacterized protein (DUF58 family)
MTLDPKLIAALDDLSLVARMVVEGFLSGLHRSPFLGYSSEFASYRPYMQGDNLRHVDWKVWGRTDTLYVKQFQDDTNLYGQLLLDTSASMDFGHPVKFEYATRLTAALAYLMVKQHDAPGLTLFGDGALQVLPARGHREQLDDLLFALSRTTARGHTRIGADLRGVVETFSRRGIAVVISDLLSEDDALFELLKLLHFQRQEGILFQVLAPEELDFEYHGEFVIEDSESGETVPVHAGAFREEYRRRLADYCDLVSRTCERYEIDYVRIRTDEPLDRALATYLERRNAIA